MRKIQGSGTLFFAFRIKGFNNETTPREKARLGARGWAGCDNGLFEHPGLNPSSSKNHGMALDSIKPEYIETYLRFGEMSDAVLSYSTGKYPGLPVYFENGFGFYVKTLRWFSGKEWNKYPSTKLNCLLFYAEAINTIYAAMDLSYRGYYSESMALARIVYETFIRVVFISVFPSRMDEAFDLNKFKIKNAEQDIKIELYEMYQMLSNFTHSHKVDVTAQLAHLINQPGASIQVSAAYDEDRFTGTHNLVLFLLWALISILPEVFTELEADSEWMAEHKFLEEEIGRWFCAHQKDFWKKAAAQLHIARDRIRAARS